MATEQDKQQVLDFIQRVMKAAESGVLEDEQEGAKALGIRLVDWVDQYKTPRRKVITNIPIIDQSSIDHHIGYRVTTSRPDYRWGFSMSRISNLVCISQQEVEALYGKPTGTYAPRHGDLRGAGTYEYRVETDRGRREASFSYTVDDRNRVCLDHFGVRFAPSKS